jgi:ribosomal protein S1
MPNGPQEQSEESENASFGDILKEFESSHKVTRPSTGKHGKPRGKRQAAPSSAVRGTVVGIAGDSVLVDHGAKSEGVIPAANLRDAAGNLTVKVGDTFDVTVTGYNDEGMAKLSRIAGPRPQDWDSLSRAFESKEIIAGRVTGSVKGGFIVDVGTRAFLPASAAASAMRRRWTNSSDRRFVAHHQTRC